jgi:hypothetical protein
MLDLYLTYIGFMLDLWLILYNALCNTYLTTLLLCNYAGLDYYIMKIITNFTSLVRLAQKLGVQLCVDLTPHAQVTR